MFTPEMLESIKKVEATRAARMAVEPRRMTAEEKQLAIQIIEDQPWFQKRKTDKASAKQWEEYKRSFKKGE